MFAHSRTADNSYHDYFVEGDRNLETIKNSLTRVLKVKNCSVDTIKFFLKQGADINCTNKHGYTPLLIALEISNNVDIIRVLLEGGAEVNKLDFYGRSPLIRYLLREDCLVSIVRVLLDFKADVNQMDYYGNSPLSTAIRNSKDEAVCRILVERGAEVNNLRYLHKTPLLVLLLKGKNCSVDTVKLLLDKGADVNCVCEFGHSPLLAALKTSRDEEVIKALLENGANVNEICEYGRTPLLSYLGLHYFGGNNCSIGIVKLLLRYKAEVNVVSIFGHTPLITALRNSLDEKIIQMLLEEGAGVDTLDDLGKSPLCIAFRHSSNDVVKLLLDYGSSPYACRYHITALHCATDFSYSGLREDILKLLLEANADVIGVVEYWQSFLCFALQRGARAHDIQLLLSAGAELNTCARHSSPLICVTDNYACAVLREDVVQLLLDNGACVNDEGLKALQNALRCKYETGAIQLLLNLPGMDGYIVTNKLLLHHAVQNPNCRLDAIKLLVNQKAQVLSENEMGEIPLHCATRKENCDPSVINLLLINGSPVNAKNKHDETPLMLAVNRCCHASILKELLIAGADIGNAEFYSSTYSRKFKLLEFLAREYRVCGDPTTLESYRMLVKFFFLQYPGYDIGHLQHASKEMRGNKCLVQYGIKKLSSFVDKCLIELRKMDLMQVGHGRTFRQFVAGNLNEKGYDLGQTLKHMTEYPFPEFLDVTFGYFPVFHDIIFARVKKLMIDQKYCPDLLSVGSVNLNYVILREIASFLSDDDFLKFILAFYNPGKHYNSGELVLGKRCSSPSCEHNSDLKYLKLY